MLDATHFSANVDDQAATRVYETKHRPLDLSMSIQRNDSPTRHVKKQVGLVCLFGCEFRAYLHYPRS